MQNTSDNPITLDSLAGMIKRGFDHTDEQLEVIRTDVEELKQGQARLERGQEDMKLELDQMTPNFEVRDLDRRVTKIENKLDAEPTQV
jgi:hypothetical protein